MPVEGIFLFYISNSAMLENLIEHKRNNFRDTGIKIVGKVPWGTHFCQFYQSKKDLIDILVPYFKRGLLENEFCMWVTADPLSVEEAKLAMEKAMPDFEKYFKRGQMEIIPYSSWYVKGGKFEESRVLEGWVSKLEKALARGFEGLRLTGNTFWIEKKDWKAFANYEETINNVIGNYKMLAICTYSLDKCGANEIVDVVSNHQFAIIKRFGKWTLIEGSEQRKVKERLINSERCFSKILSSIGDAVIATDAEGKIIFMNPVAENLTGWKMDRVLGSPIEKVFHVINEHTRKEVDNPVFSAFKKKSTVCLADHSILISKDKTEIPVEDSAAVIRDNRKNICGMVLIFRDISQRREIEKRLSHLASFPNMNPNPIIELTAGGDVGYLNPAAESIFSDIKDLGLRHPYLNRWPAVVSKIKNGRQNFLKREVNVGSGVYLQTIQYEKSLDVFRIYGKDFTGYKRIEDILRKSEAKFKALYESNIVGIVIGDVKNNIYDANNAFLKIIGYTREELRRGKINCTKLTAKEYMETDRKIIEELLAKGVTSQWEKEYIRRDGTRVPVIIGKVLTNKGTAETISFVLDITERKKLERKKDEFMGTASHELKTPITIIQAFAQILHKRFEQSQDSQNEYFVKNISDQVKRLTNLVNNLLDVSKIQAGKLKFNYKVYDFDVLIRKTIVDFQYITKTHQIERYGEAGELLYGDEERIHQVMVNLISNAVKYSPEANRIIIHTIKRNNQILVGVQDFGFGVSKSNSKKIFERFYTGRENVKKNIPGFGMGLYICREVIEGHGGKLWVESRKGKGSTFFFTLSLSKDSKMNNNGNLRIKDL